MMLSSFLSHLNRYGLAGCYQNLRKVTSGGLTPRTQMTPLSCSRARSLIMGPRQPFTTSNATSACSMLTPYSTPKLTYSIPKLTPKFSSQSQPTRTKSHSLPSQADLFQSKRYYSQQNSSKEDISAPQTTTKDKWENIYTIPNFLTAGRFIAAPFLGYMVCSEQYGAACTLFLLAGLTDLLDGYIARNWPGQSSILGTVIDPLADKFLVTILSVSLTVVHLLPVWLMAVILSRDVYLVISGFRVRYVTLPPPKTMKRYFDFSLPSATVKPTFISKVNTNIQILLLAASIAAPVFDFINHPMLHLLWGATAITTTWSFVSYLTTAPYTVLKK